MDEEYRELIDELLAYFEIGPNHEGEWPMDTVYSGGDLVRGPISDELYSILVQLADLREADDGN